MHGQFIEPVAFLLSPGGAESLQSGGTLIGLLCRQIELNFATFKPLCVELRTNHRVAGR